MSYSIDLTRISLQTFQDILKRKNLLESRRILQNDLEANFQRIAGADVSSLSALKKELSSSQKLAKFAARTNISKEYLIMLKRELGSLEQKPVPVSDFLGLNRQTVQTLAEHGLKTSNDVFCAFQNEGAKRSLLEKTGISRNELDEVFCLSGLVRINGVGAAAARSLYEAGYKDIEEVASADAGVLLERISAVNAKGAYYHAKLGRKDMQFVIDAAAFLRDLEKS